jgi:hypothetical protein
VIFGILLGLLAVATCQNYAAFGGIVDKEASSISALYRDFLASPQPLRGPLQGELREDIRFTIEEAWDQQRKGWVPREGSKRITSILRLLLAFETSKESEKIIGPAVLR